MGKFVARRGYLEEAEGNYKKITDYEIGKFDENHAEWLAGTKRLKEAREALKRYHQELVLGETPAQKAPQAIAAPTAPKPQPTTPAPATTQSADTENTGPLNSIVAYELKKAAQSLTEVEKLLSADMDSGPAGKIAHIQPLLEDIRQKLDSIRKNNAGKFNQQHPDFVAVIKRQTAAKQALAAFRAENSVQLAAQKTYTKRIKF